MYMPTGVGFEILHAWPHLTCLDMTEMYSGDYDPQRNLDFNPPDAAQLAVNPVRMALRGYAALPKL